MPLYSYRCGECGRVQHKLMGMQEIHPQYVDCPCGESMAVRSIAEDWRDTVRGGNPWRTGLVSKAAGVAKKQVAEAAAYDAAAGVPTEYDARGNAIFTSRSHRKKWCEVHGYVDVDGGYGDYTGR